MTENEYWALITRRLAGDISSEENDLLDSWIEASESNQALYEEACQAWKRDYFNQKDFDVADGKKLLQQKLKVYPIHQVEKKSTAPFYLKIAASVALLLGVGLAVYFNQSASEEKPAIVYIEKIIPAGAKQTLKLGDGTVVKINSESVLKVPKHFAADERVVYLEGEAFFDVARDTARPFRIISGEVTTSVLGTSFNIAAYPELSKLKVSVASGKVQVNETVQPDNKVVLISDQEASFDLEQQEFAVAAFDVAQAFAWKDSTLLFNDTPLEAVAKKLERWYGVNILFKNEDIKQCLLSGEFKNESLDNVLESLRYTSDINYKIEDKNITLSGKGCD
ncbi:DUF4974 domain-containing protein [Flammeovirgaceae bacterium SG7u.111]|nr:DUF4974 domain-containing protein [Flammeovirgaceae bacterium SG7u.132]WPO37433.1 DUF4974 domain-containing protein [Flammeovirgaceae bacterium SG7u.111]